MTSAKSVTVFVRRNGGIFLATTHLAEAAHPNSAALAVRACAARSLGVSESVVEVLPESPNVMIGALRTFGPAKRDCARLWAAGGVLVIASALMFAMLALATGGVP